MTQHITEHDAAGLWMHSLLCDLYPMFRGLTGEGNRQTLAALAQHIPLHQREVATGSRVFDWTVPHEWRFRDAWVKDRTGRRVIDARMLNLHVVSHSMTVHQTMNWNALRPRLRSLPDRPHAVPYHHAYFRNTWGFCVSHQTLQALELAGAGPYEVCIDAEFIDGALTYGEVVLPGRLRDQVLISAHICHPSLCNDNLSGIVVAAALAQRLLNRQRQYTYRFVFAPATLGALAFLSQAGASIAHVRHGLVLTGLGDPGALTYKRSRWGNAEVDGAAASVVEGRGGGVIDFTPTGYDERQYGSPGFNLPVGTLMRSEPGSYPQYHTSHDNPAFVTAAALADSLDACEQILARLEARAGCAPAAVRQKEIGGGRAYRNLSPYGEPQLSRRQVFTGDAEVEPLAVQWVLNLSDGLHDLAQIADRSDLSHDALQRAADRLVAVNLLEPLTPSAAQTTMTGSFA